MHDSTGTLGSALRSRSQYIRSAGPSPLCDAAELSALDNLEARDPDPDAFFDWAPGSLSE
jgi:hypothetical protein